MQSRSQCVEVCSRSCLLAAWGEQRQIEFGEIDQIRACVRPGCGFHKASGELEVFAIACGQNDEVALLLSGHLRGMAKGSSSMVHSLAGVAMTADHAGLVSLSRQVFIGV